MATTVVTTSGMSQPSVVTTSPFNDDAPQYRMCCHHVTKVCLLVGAQDMAVAVLVVISMLIAITRGDQQSTPGAVLGAIVVMSCATSLLIFLYKGIRQERPNYLLPYLILYWLWIGFWGLVLFIVIISMCSTTRVEAVSIVVLVLSVLYICLRVYLQLIVHRTYGYLRDKQRSHMTGVVLSQPGVVQVINTPGPTTVVSGYVYTTTSYVPSTSQMPQPINDDMPPAYNDVVKTVPQ